MPEQSLFVFSCRDHDASVAGPLRQHHLEAHFRHIEANAARIAVAGPVYAEDGETIAGSLLVFHAESEAEARTLFEADPYFSAGIWAEINVQPFLAAAGTWIGGPVWD